MHNHPIECHGEMRPAPMSLGNAPREAVSFDGEEWAEDADYDPGETADGEKYFDDKWGEDLNEESDFAGYIVRTGLERRC